MAGLVTKTVGDAAEFFEVQSDGWWMWVASVLRATGDSIERICVNTWGVSSGGRVSPSVERPSAQVRLREKQIESRFTKLG
jgi:hypothetical protein